MTTSIDAPRLSARGLRPDRSVTPTPLVDAPGHDEHAVSTVPSTRPRRAPAWERPALVGLLVATAVLYLWGLGASGWANAFYSAAVQAGSVSWKAFFFGSFDAANFITVDKPPLSLWPMALSVRLFGLSSWSILVPQALDGRRHCRSGLRIGASLVHPGGRPDRRCRRRAHARRGADVPLQQP